MSSRRRRTGSRAEEQLVRELTEGSRIITEMSAKVVTIWIVGLLLVVLGILTLAISNSYIRQQVIQRVLIRNGSEVYPVWQEPQLPIYLQIYVWDLQNPEEVKEGLKPRVKEKGPYTYKEHLVKVNVTHHPNATISYRQIKTYHFVREMSNGSDTDLFTTINIPLITLADAVEDDSYISKLIADIMAKFSSEKLFIRKTVHEIVWGYHDKMLHYGQELDPKRFDTDFVGVLTGHNATDDGLYTIFTGESDITKLGYINKYNGSSYLPFWSTPYANMVNGSDGSLCPPFVKKDFTLRIFLSDICRSVYTKYHDVIYTKHSIELYRFQAPRSAMESAAENPDNAGFCTPLGNCMGTGVLNMSTCQIVDGFHIPVVASYPHFFMADEEYVNNITGMHPDARYHTTDVDIEPNTGIVMEVAKRMQINIQIDPVRQIEQVKYVRRMVYPVLWINESFVIDDEHALQVKNELLIPKMAVQTTVYTAITLGGMMAILAAALTGTSCNANKKKKKDKPEDSESDPADNTEDAGVSPTPDTVTVTVSGEVHNPPNGVVPSINGDVPYHGDDEDGYDDDDDTQMLVSAAAPMAYEAPIHQNDPPQPEQDAKSHSNPTNNSISSGADGMDQHPSMNSDTLADTAVPGPDEGVPQPVFLGIEPVNGQGEMNGSALDSGKNEDELPNVVSNTVEDVPVLMEKNATDSAVNGVVEPEMDVQNGGTDEVMDPELYIYAAGGDAKTDSVKDAVPAVATGDVHVGVSDGHQNGDEDFSQVPTPDVTNSDLPSATPDVADASLTGAAEC